MKRENDMGTKVGLWIDHREAHIMAITDKNEELGLVISKVEKQPRRDGDSRHAGPYEAMQVQADDSRQRARTGHLNTYYDSIIASIHNAESILVFGPGEAKDELVKRIMGTDLGKRVEAVEAADRMTDHQIASKIREHFAEKS
jgi:stalled ribosome rescue protein Dom34